MNGGSPDDYQFMQWLQQNRPEVAQQLTGMGTLDERGDLLQQQLAQAMALMKPGRQRRTGLGNIYQGIGDLGGAIMGGVAAANTQGQQQDLLKQKDAGRLAAQQAMAEWLMSLGAEQGGDISSAPQMLGPEAALIATPRRKRAPAVAAPPPVIAAATPQERPRAPWETPTDPYYSGF